MKDVLKVNDIITLHGVKYQVRELSYNSRYWLNCEDSFSNDYVFKLLDINPRNFQRSVLNYEMDGDFPYCASLEDLTKFAEAIKNYGKSGSDYLYTVSAADMQRLYKTASSSCKWRGIIKERYADDIFEGSNCMVPASLLTSARGDANNEQLKVINEVFKVIYKVGDWVITKGYANEYEGKALQITRIEDDRYCYFEPKNSETPNFSIGMIDRYATESEIEAAENTCPYKDGELIFVKDDNYIDWNLRRSTGRMVAKQVQVYGCTNCSNGLTTWEQHAPASHVKLPTI